MRRIIRELLMSLSLLSKADKLKQTLTWSGRMFQVSAAQYNTIQYTFDCQSTPHGSFSETIVIIKTLKILKNYR